jgi:hypothetical protein
MKISSNKIRSLKDSNDMVSEIVGTVLILGITIAIISTLYTIVLAYPSPSDSPFVDLVATVEGDTIIIEHRGGDGLGFETKVTIIIDDQIDEFTIDEQNYLDAEAKMNNRWNVGERLVIPFVYSLNYSEAEITVIDESNIIVLKGILDISPGCDIGLMIEGSGGSSQYFNFIAKNYRSDIDSTVASIQITFPDGVTYIPPGPGIPPGTTFDNETNIWYIESFSVGNNLTLELLINEVPPGMIVKSELISSNPMDINCANNIAIYP